MERKQRSSGIIDDTFFRRFFVPLIISILVIAGIFVIIAAPPGTAVSWKSQSSLFGNAANAMNGGRRH
jgi:hypothetical protein